MNCTLFLDKVHNYDVVRDYFDCFNIVKVITKDKYTFVNLSDKASAIEILKMKQYVINGQLTQVSMAKSSLKRDGLTPEEQKIVDRVEDPSMSQLSVPEAATYSRLMEQKKDFLRMRQGEQQRQHLHQLQLMQTMGSHLQANRNASLPDQPSNLPTGNLGNSQQLVGHLGASPLAPPSVQYVRPNDGPLSPSELKELVDQLNMVRTPDQPLLCFPPTTNVNPTISPERPADPQFASRLVSPNVGASSQSGAVNNQVLHHNVNQQTIIQLNTQVRTTALQSGHANQRPGQQSSLPNTSLSQTLQNLQNYPQIGQQMSPTSSDWTASSDQSAKTRSEFPEW